MHLFFFVFVQLRFFNFLFSFNSMIDNLVFDLTQLNSAVLNALDNTSLRITEIDPLGRAHATGPGHYTATLRALGQAFANCFAND